jgi:hypothetical protein
VSDLRSETLQIPQAVRDEVNARDLGHCRFCGRTDGFIALHHCLFGGDYTGMGGRRIHDPRFIISVGGAFQHDCHRVIHSRKSLWMPLSIEVVNHPGATMLQLKRWSERSARMESRGSGMAGRIVRRRGLHNPPR